MNEKYTKVIIFLIQSVEWIILIGVFALGVKAINDAENRFIVAMIALAGIGLINFMGRWSLNKIAQLRYDIKKQENIAKGKDKSDLL